MKNKKLRIVLITFFVAIAGSCSFAADSISHKYPVAVLAELKSEQSRVQALVKDKRYKELEEVKRDIIGENTAMVNDYKDNFHYCPVYFFSDTNVDFILKKQFDGVLLGSDLEPAKNVVVDAASKDYVIIFYGYPTEQSHNIHTVEDSSKYQNNSGEPMGRGLIICNESMQQINYLYMFGYDALFANKKLRKYNYSSKHFNIEYFPTAADFNGKLKSRDKHQGNVPRRLNINKTNKSE